MPDEVGSIPDGFTVVAVGDLLVSRPVSSMSQRLPGFGKLIESIGAADVTMGNLETTLFDVRHGAGEPLGWEDETPLHSEPGLARDLRTMGFDLLGRANNHALDWGVESMRRTDRILADAGLEHAGTGSTASEARAARYMETPRARVALVSLTTSPATPIAAAVDPWRGDRGRAGVNWLPARRTVVAPPEVMAALGQIRDAVPELDTRWIPSVEGDPCRIELAHQSFEQGEEFGERFDIDASVLEENVRSVRLARRYADVVVVAIHAHQGDRRPHQPRGFLREVAHAFVDAGADLVAISGPHTLAPVEAYAGRAIVYGLGNFFWHVMSEPVQRYLVEQPSDVIGERLTARLGSVPASDQDVLDVLDEDFEEEGFFDALVARLVFEGGVAARLELIPAVLGNEGPLTVRGLPNQANAADADRILSSVVQWSASLGTSVRIERALGIVDLH